MESLARGSEGTHPVDTLILAQGGIDPGLQISRTIRKQMCVFLNHQIWGPLLQ